MDREILDAIKKQQSTDFNRIKTGVDSGLYYPMLLMSSYCDDNPKCTVELPCEDCLKMSNIVLVAKTQVKGENVVCGYDFLNGSRNSNP